MSTGKVLLQLIAQARHFRGVRLAGLQRSRQQLLVQPGCVIRLVELMVLPELPAEHQRHGESATREQRLAVALPPILDLCQLFFFGTRGHAVTPSIRLVSDLLEAGSQTLG